MARIKTSAGGTAWVPGPPKRTRQGNGVRSKPRGTRKLRRGQGKG
ncbi:MAG: hypothetical protein WBM08_13900 [Prochlorococcaceae cyanobacterium]